MTSNILFVDLAKKKEILANNNVQLYPNPMFNELIIEIDGNYEKLNFEILNTLGQVVHNGELINKTTIDSFNHPSGLYVIKIEVGNSFLYKYVIKE